MLACVSVPLRLLTAVLLPLHLLEDLIRFRSTDLGLPRLMNTESSTSRPGRREIRHQTQYSIISLAPEGTAVEGMLKRRRGHRAIENNRHNCKKGFIATQL